VWQEFLSSVVPISLGQSKRRRRAEFITRIVFGGKREEREERKTIPTTFPTIDQFSNLFYRDGRDFTSSSGSIIC